MQLAFLEAMGYCRYGGVGMGIGVHTDCSTPALAREDDGRPLFLTCDLIFILSIETLEF